MFTRGKVSFASVLAAVVLVLCISGSVVGINYALDSGVAWAQLNPWTDGGSYLYPTQTTDSVITGANTTGSADIFLGADGSAIFNDQSNDADFRVEGNSDTHLLFADASLDFVSIGTSTSPSKFYVYDSGTFTVPATTVQLTLQNSGGSSYPAGICIISDATGSSQILLGDEANTSSGLISYANSSDDMSLTATDDIILEGDTIDLDGGQRIKRTTKSAAYTISVVDYYIGCDPSGGAFTLTLPRAATAGEGAVFFIKNETNSTNTITVAGYDVGDDEDEIEDELTQATSTAYGWIKVMSTGTNDDTESWVILDEH